MNKRKPKPAGSTVAETVSTVEPKAKELQLRRTLPPAPPTPNRWFLLISAALLAAWNMILLGMALYDH